MNRSDRLRLAFEKTGITDLVNALAWLMMHDPKRRNSKTAFAELRGLSFNPSRTVGDYNQTSIGSRFNDIKSWFESDPILSKMYVFRSEEGLQLGDNPNKDQNLMEYWLDLNPDFFMTRHKKQDQVYAEFHTIQENNGQVIFFEKLAQDD